MKNSTALFLLLIALTPTCLTHSFAEKVAIDKAAENIAQQGTTSPKKSLLNLLKKDSEGNHLGDAPVIECSTLTLRNLVPYSYPFETHTVVTPDGYYLTLFRLQAKGTSMKFGKPVVFLQHGLFNDANSWLLNGEPHALAFKLANAGFDVWMGNNRGNKFSRRHKYLSTSDPRYWNFSFDEMAKYDLPTQLAFVSA